MLSRPRKSLGEFKKYIFQLFEYLKHSQGNRLALPSFPSGQYVLGIYLKIHLYHIVQVNIELHKLLPSGTSQYGPA